MKYSAKDVLIQMGDSIVDLNKVNTPTYFRTIHSTPEKYVEHIKDEGDTAFFTLYDQNNKPYSVSVKKDSEIHLAIKNSDPYSSKSVLTVTEKQDD